MIGWNAHLRERRLIEFHVAEQSGEARDLRAAEHLADCPACRERYDGISTLLDEVRQEAESATDAVFPPERLAEQRAAIARRIEQVGQSARVISFPGRELHLAAAARSRVAPRWVAAGAAAGLFIGIGVGVFFDPHVPGTSMHQVATTRPAAQPPSASATLAGQKRVPDAVPLAAAVDEMTAMWEMELVMERPHTRSLSAFDAFTPSSRDVSYEVR